MDITNPQLTDFCNGNARVVADKLSLIAASLPATVAIYNARNLGTIIDAAGAANLIADGSETDGRTRVVGGDVYNLITLLNDLNTFLTQGRKDVIAKWQVNGAE